MTTTSEPAKTVETVSATIDGVQVVVPKDTLIIRAAEDIGVQVPRFCDHPLLDPIGACRQCIVEVEGQRKPMTACTTMVTDGMVVKTQLTSEMAAKAQSGTMEMLLINHPLDCPVCDKGGECPLQNQAMSNGRAESRFRDEKRVYPKPLAISAEILLDRERCVLCARCTRFSDQIAGDPFIDLFERGALEQVAVYRDEEDGELDQPFHSYFSGNTIQICPVGALTSATYRFRARPFDLVSTPSVCEHCASGCAQRTDWRRNTVMRRLAGDDPDVNEEWNCDKGRFAFTYANAPGRLTTPLVRDSETGQLQPASWTEALSAAAEGLAQARESGGVGVLAGGRLTIEDAYAYAKFTRVALGSNDIDFRARPHSEEEADFLASRVAGVTPATGGVTYGAVEDAPTVLLVGFEPEEESPIVYVRLRKAVRKKGQRVLSVAPWGSRGLDKLSGTLIQAAPGAEPKVLDALAKASAIHGSDFAELAEELRKPGAVIMAGERLAAIPGALSAAARLADTTGAALAWVPRRAGERGAIAAGALPNMLVGARSIFDPAARAELAQAWGVPGGHLPSRPGRDTAGIIAAAETGELAGLVVAGIDPEDLPAPLQAERALDSTRFLVSLELRESAVTRRADVVFPVAPAPEKAGSYLSWEGRERPFEQTLPGVGALSDAKVLDALATEWGLALRCSAVEDIRAELRRLGAVSRGFVGRAVANASVSERPQPRQGQALLSTWHHLLDRGRLQADEENLAATAPRAVARLSAATAFEIGLAEGELLRVSTNVGALTLPLAVTVMPDRVVWVPTNSDLSTVHRALGVDAGQIVDIGPPAAMLPAPARSKSSSHRGEVEAE